jgi:penicillin-binding protein 1A
VVGGLLTCGIAAVLTLFVSLQIPPIRTLADYRPPLTTLILDRKGAVVDRIFQENRYLVSLSDLPELLPKAFLAAEDARFFQHSGVDAWSVIRALVNNLSSGHRSQGGSTITQQVARALLLTPEKTYSRKVKEAVLAYRIDRAFSKEEILIIYLNQIYFGEGAYGVEAAARTYFGRSARELSLGEMAMLAGLPQAPSRYAPFKHLDLAKKRQAYVLNRMAEDGYITPTAARKAFKQTMLWGPPLARKPELQYFLQQVRNQVRNKYGADLLATGGLTIQTSLDQEMQSVAVQALHYGIAAWQARHRDDQASGSPQAALVALEPRSGKIRALMGGVDFSASQFDRAVQARRQPGSAFKPFIYAVALEQGMTPGTILLDEPLTFPGAKAGEVWQPENYSGEYHGPTTLRDGLIFSRNVVTIKMLQQIGIKNVVALARRLGIKSPLTPTLSLALGTSEVSLLELTGAYAGFANNGMAISPLLIDSITDAQGHVMEKNLSRHTQAISPQAAFQVTNLMEKVIQEGTGRQAQGLQSAAAGKTGTTDSNIDAWFIGFTPNLVTGVWMGFDRKKSLGRLETGGLAAAPVWRYFMRQVEATMPQGNFVVPEGIVIQPMNRETGEPVDEETDNVSWEAFRQP